MTGKFIVNGKEIEVNFNSTDTLVRVLRDNGYTEVKEGCGKGNCGACAVLIDDVLQLSCQILAASVVNSKVTTVKGIGDIHNPHIIQKSFVEAGAVQCGFCTPGKVLATYYLLRKNSHPTEDEIRHGLDGHICRCTGYTKIIDAVKLASERMDDND